MATQIQGVVVAKPPPPPEFGVTSGVGVIFSENLLFNVSWYSILKGKLYSTMIGQSSTVALLIGVPGKILALQK